MTPQHKKRILFLSWKDIFHPSSGGAEILTDALASHMAKSCDVTYFTSSFPGAENTRIHNGYTIIRKGSIRTATLHAWIYWHTHGMHKAYDLIVDQVHGVPFFSPLYYKHPNITTLIYEIAGDLWARILPRNIGLWIDAIWLWLYKHQSFITISNSTKQELLDNNISAANIGIIPMFTHIHLETLPKKPKQFTYVILGRIAPVKRIEHAIAAFSIVQQELPNARLIIAGKYESTYKDYAQTIRTLIASNPNIQCMLNISEEEKIALLKTSHVLLMPSQKEGYGIVILEAAACGAPTIAYNVPGARDAILPRITGILAHTETPEALAQCMQELIHDTTLYEHMQREAFTYAQTHTEQRTSEYFEHMVRYTH